MSTRTFVVRWRPGAEPETEELPEDPIFHPRGYSQLVVGIATVIIGNKVEDIVAFKRFDNAEDDGSVRQHQPWRSMTSLHPAVQKLLDFMRLRMPQQPYLRLV